MIWIFVYTGNQGTSWHNVTVSVPQEAGRLILETERGSSYTSDIALDDVLLVDAPCEDKGKVGLL